MYTTCITVDYITIQDKTEIVCYSNEANKNK